MRDSIIFCGVCKSKFTQDNLSINTPASTIFSSLYRKSGIDLQLKSSWP